MASIHPSTTATLQTSLSSSRIVNLPDIPELFNANFLDVLVPKKGLRKASDESSRNAHRNPMMDALEASSYPINLGYTTNGAHAYTSTSSLVLDAFNGLTRDISGASVKQFLSDSWKESPDLTLRLIWNLRSIHDGVGDKELFYQAFGWLYNNHPSTAISNLHNLVTPACTSKGKEGRKSHGYWKDLLNILALETVDELSSIYGPAEYLHHPRMPYTFGRYKKRSKSKKGTPQSRIEESLLASQKVSVEAAIKRKEKDADNHKRLLCKLSQPKFRALYIAVARLFADEIGKDLKTVLEIEALPFDGDRLPLVKKLSLAGKWAPSPGRSHDRITNISTAIAELIYAAQVLPAHAYPSALRSALPAHERAVILRSFYQRWILTQLRRMSEYPEPLMSAGKWKEIKYNRVSSRCMKNNTPQFFKHDGDGFEKYLTGVEENKRSISGATLPPHELVAQAVSEGLSRRKRNSNKAYSKPFSKKLEEIKRRVAEAQWKTLLSNLRQTGTIENSIAICDVSGSMGSLWIEYDKKNIQPVLLAVSLSLVLASLAQPPFNGGFITFSEEPQYVTVDLTQPLFDQVSKMGQAHWGENTDLQSVFIDLLLPLAIKNKVKQEDMIKRLFVFSDMQFDQCHGNWVYDNWETNHDCIEAAFKEAGYEMPQVVYWDLSSANWTRTVEVKGDREGVALMNGFSPAMLKVFMGEDAVEEREEESADDMEWESVNADGESVTLLEGEDGNDEDEDFTPINVMKKALMRASYDGLVVVD